MSHIDPGRERLRAKMLDHANQSVRGHRSSGRATRRHLQTMSQVRRAMLKQPLQHLHDIRCSGADDCVCDACEFDGDARVRVRRGYGRWWNGFIIGEPRGIDHLAPGYRMARKKLIEFDGEFEPWFSWLKANLPDTLAGRHLLDHIVSDAKSNIRDFEHDLLLSQRRGFPRPVPWGLRPEDREHLQRRPGEPTFTEALRQYSELRWTAWEEWLAQSFEQSEAGQLRMKYLRYLMDRAWL